MNMAGNFLGFIFAAAALPVFAGSDGKDIYKQSCVACHGANGKGTIPGSPDFTKAGSPLRVKDDETLTQNVLRGFRSPGSPMAMPPNSSLSERDAQEVIRYMKATFASANR